MKCELYVHTHVPFVLSHFCIASVNCRDLNESKDVLAIRNLKPLIMPGEHLHSYEY